MLDLKFLGIGSAFNTELGNNSAFVKEDDTLFLIDLGSSNFDRIKKSNILEDVKKINVFVTHVHGDHIGGLSDLIYYSFFSMKDFLKKKITVFSLEDTKTKEVLEIMGCQDGFHYDYKDLKENEFFNMGEFKIKPFKTIHYPSMNSYGLILKDDKKKIFYSGDANYKTYENISILKDDYDKLFLDVSSSHFEGNPHLSLFELCELFPEKTERNKVFCMHIDEKFDRNKVASLGFSIAELF